MKSQINKFLFVLAMVVLPPVIFTACGGGGSNPVTSVGSGTVPTQTQALIQRFLGAMPGFHGSLHAVQNASLNRSSPLELEAQTTTQVVFTGNYTGFCQTLPIAQTVVVYGLGRYTDSNCAQNFQNFVNPTDGEPVIGNGTLSNLVLLGSGGSTAQSGVLTVYVNGQPTQLTATLGTSKKVQNTTTTVAVNDGDYVAALFTTLTGDNFQNVRVYIGKQ